MDCFHETQAPNSPRISKKYHRRKQHLRLCEYGYIFRQYTRREQVTVVGTKKEATRKKAHFEAKKFPEFLPQNSILV